MQGHDRLEHLVDDRRRQAHRGLVEHQHARLGHQGAADGQHLLLAAAHQAGHLAAPFLQAREQVVDPRDQVALRAAPGVGC